MSPYVRELFRQASELDEQDRAVLAGLLLESLEPEVDEHVESAWPEEIARRLTELVYRSTVFWTPAGLKLGCLSQGTPLLVSHLGRGFVSVPPNQPRLIVLTLKLVQR